jgi:threonine dehydrogenase-like Zn-dependent dehydrogenase
MRAAVTRGGQLVVGEVPDPTPSSGHVVARSLAAGICGSDLHALSDFARFTGLMGSVGIPALDPAADCVFGHEFCAEIVDHGPDTARTLAVGTRVCSVPVIVGPAGVEQIGYSNAYPGALAEHMVLQELLCLPVPDGLATELAALTEPLAVGEHAVGLAHVSAGQPCLVVGCGPVGLAVIAALKARGHGPVLAADFSSGRRRLAEAFGADEVLDPALGSPHDRWPDFGIARTVMERVGNAMLGATVPDPVIFEAVGIPGMLQSLLSDAPPHSRIVVVGVCMETDAIEPFVAVTKEMELRFSFGYTPDEFATTLQRLGAGIPGTDLLVTAAVDLAGAPGAFETLRRPGEHGKILVTPTSPPGPGGTRESTTDTTETETDDHH